MSVADQILNFVKTLVWPAVVVTAVLTFRPQLARLISRVTEVSAAGASVKFSDEVDELADTADSVLREVRGNFAPEETPPLPVSTLQVEKEPTAAFLDAYRELETAAREVAVASGATSPLLIPVLKGLADKDLLPDEAVHLGEELRSIRNRVAHALQHLTPEDATGLVAAANSLANACRAITEGIEDPD
jgi:hypothetical protein